MEKDYLKRILDNDFSILHGIYEPPNNIPILRYKVIRDNYKVIVLGNSLMKLSCLNFLAAEEIKPEYIFDNLDDLDKIDKSHKYFLIITDDYKYTAYQKKLFQKMKEKGIEDYLCPYDYEKIPKHDISYLDYFKKNKSHILDMFDMLHDHESRQTCAEYIRSKIYCDFYRLKQNPTWNKYFDKAVYEHIDNEVFVNCGSSNGDTIFYFLENFETFSKIIALEADQNRIEQFKSNLSYLKEKDKNKIYFNNTIVDNEINKLDYICQNEKVSLINMDIEGMELEVLKGARNIIKENMPVIAACAYHLPTDLYELPMFLKEISDDYEIFYRKYASTVRNRFCNAELVMYGVPIKRLKK